MLDEMTSIFNNFFNICIYLYSYNIATYMQAKTDALNYKSKVCSANNKTHHIVAIFCQ